MLLLLNVPNAGDDDVKQITAEMYRSENENDSVDRLEAPVVCSRMQKTLNTKDRTVRFSPPEKPAITSSIAYDHLKTQYTIFAEK